MGQGFPSSTKADIDEDSPEQSLVGAGLTVLFESLFSVPPREKKEGP